MGVEHEATSETRETGGRGRIEAMMMRPVVALHQFGAPRGGERPERTPVGGSPT
jgi:hypothetical protein